MKRASAWPLLFLTPWPCSAAFISGPSKPTAGSVTTQSIQPQAVTEDKISTGAVTNSRTNFTGTLLIGGNTSEINLNLIDTNFWATPNPIILRTGIPSLQHPLFEIFLRGFEDTGSGIQFFTGDGAPEGFKIYGRNNGFHLIMGEDKGGVPGSIFDSSGELVYGKHGPFILGISRDAQGNVPREILSLGSDIGGQDPTAAGDVIFTTKRFKIRDTIYNSFNDLFFIDDFESNKSIKLFAPTSIFSPLSMNSNKIENLGTPTLATDAANKGYVDTATAGANISNLGDVTIATVTIKNRIEFSTKTTPVGGIDTFEVYSTSSATGQKAQFGLVIDRRGLGFAAQQAILSLRPLFQTGLDSDEFAMVSLGPSQSDGTPSFGISGIITGKGTLSSNMNVNHFSWFTPPGEKFSHNSGLWDFTSLDVGRHSDAFGRSGEDFGSINLRRGKIDILVPENGAPLDSGLNLSTGSLRFTGPLGTSKITGFRKLDGVVGDSEIIATSATLKHLAVSTITATAEFELLNNTDPADKKGTKIKGEGIFFRERGTDVGYTSSILAGDPITEGGVLRFRTIRNGTPQGTFDFLIGTPQALAFQIHTIGAGSFINSYYPHIFNNTAKTLSTLIVNGGITSDGSQVVFNKSIRSDPGMSINAPIVQPLTVRGTGGGIAGFQNSSGQTVLIINNSGNITNTGGGANFIGDITADTATFSGNIVFTSTNATIAGRDLDQIIVSTTNSPQLQERIYRGKTLLPKNQVTFTELVGATDIASVVFSPIESASSLDVRLTGVFSSSFSVHNLDLVTDTTAFWQAVAK